MSGVVVETVDFKSARAVFMQKQVEKQHEWTKGYAYRKKSKDDEELEKEAKRRQKEAADNAKAAVVEANKPAQPEPKKEAMSEEERYVTEVMQQVDAGVENARKDIVEKGHVGKLAKMFMTQTDPRIRSKCARVIHKIASHDPLLAGDLAKTGGIVHALKAGVMEDVAGDVTVNSLKLLTDICNSVEDMSDTDWNAIDDYDLIKRLFDLLTHRSEETQRWSVIFLVSINLRYLDSKENKIFKKLRGAEKHTNADQFGSMMIGAFNTNECGTPVPFLKLFNDVYAAGISDVYYTNDFKVLIDILLVHIANGPGEQVMVQYLRCLNGSIKFGKYDEHKHRKDDVKECLSELIESGSSAEVKKSAQAIYDENPKIWDNVSNSIFKKGGPAKGGPAKAAAPAPAPAAAKFGGGPVKMGGKAQPNRKEVANDEEEWD